MFKLGNLRQKEEFRGEFLNQLRLYIDFVNGNSDNHSRALSLKEWEKNIILIASLFIP